MRFVTALFTVFLLSACNNGPSLNADGSSNPDAKSLMPEDPTIAAIYDRSCKACHSRGISGAPKTGNKDHWEPRITKGMDVLLQNTIGGFRAMPPRGACMDCNPEQFESLIRFMANWPAINQPAGAQ